MSSTRFTALPDLAVLEIFSYLSCEDVLYAFARLHNERLFRLIIERGAFQQICLSSQMDRQKYYDLARGVWRFDLIRSLVCREVFSDVIVQFSPCPHFTSLTDLRLLAIGRVGDIVAPFILAHSSTLTHLTVKRRDQGYSPVEIEALLQTVVPQLHQLQSLSTDLNTGFSVRPIQRSGQTSVFFAFRFSGLD